MILCSQPGILSYTAKINSQRLSHGKVIHHNEQLQIAFAFFLPQGYCITVGNENTDRIIKSAVVVHPSDPNISVSP